MKFQQIRSLFSFYTPMVTGEEWGLRFQFEPGRYCIVFSSTDRTLVDECYREMVQRLELAVHHVAIRTLRNAARQVFATAQGRVRDERFLLEEVALDLASVHPAALERFPDPESDEFPL